MAQQFFSGTRGAYYPVQLFEEIRQLSAVHDNIRLIVWEAIPEKNPAGSYYFISGW